MKRGRMILRGVVIVSGAALTALAIAKENPYQSIIDRNAFGLKPPPPPQTNPVQETPPLIVKLTGVSNLGGEPKAFFEMTEPGPGKQPKRPSGMIKGEKLDGVEVLQIDVDKGEVTVKNGTVETTLNFEKDGIKSAPGAGGAAKTAAVTPMTLPPVRPGMPGSSPITTPNIGTPNLGAPNQSVIVTGGSGTPTPGSAIVTGGAGSSFAYSGNTPATGLTPIPQRTLRFNPTDGQVNVTPGVGSATPAHNAVPVGPQVSYEESILRVAVNTELTGDLVRRGEHPPFPPTELTPDPPKLPGAIDVQAQAQAAPDASVPRYNPRQIK